MMSAKNQLNKSKSDFLKSFIVEIFKNRRFESSGNKKLKFVISIWAFVTDYNPDTNRDREGVIPLALIKNKIQRYTLNILFNIFIKNYSKR